MLPTDNYKMGGKRYEHTEPQALCTNFCYVAL